MVFCICQNRLDYAAVTKWLSITTVYFLLMVRSWCELPGNSASHLPLGTHPDALSTILWQRLLRPRLLRGPGELTPPSPLVPTAHSPGLILWPHLTASELGMQRSTRMRIHVSPTLSHGTIPLYLWFAWLACFCQMSLCPGLASWACILCFHMGLHA